MSEVPIYAVCTYFFSCKLGHCLSYMIWKNKHNLKHPVSHHSMLFLYKHINVACHIIYMEKYRDFNLLTACSFNPETWMFCRN
jgi:hypothetical protein